MAVAEKAFESDRLIETGALKPETLTTPVLEVIPMELEIKFEKLVLAHTTRGGPSNAPQFKPGEVSLRN